MLNKITVAAAVVLLAFGAHAAPMEMAQGFTVSMHTTELEPAVDFGTFNKFDSSLGSLTGAILSLNGEAVFTFDAKNVAAQGQRADLTSATDLFFSSDLAALDALLLPIDVGMSYSTGFLSYAVDEQKFFGPEYDSGSDTLDLSSILADLTGPGTFNVACETLSSFTVRGGGGNISTNQATQAGCSVDLVYYYEEGDNEAPEPGSLALLGLALAGAGAMGRRRKAA